MFKYNVILIEKIPLRPTQLKKEQSMKRIIIVIQLLFISLLLFPGDSEADIMQRGLNYFKNESYIRALDSFDIVAARGELLAGDALYWKSRVLEQLKRYSEAEESLVLFLEEYSDNPFYPDGFYLRARLFYLQREYEKAIETFYMFITRFKSHKLVVNSYFWIGESLFELGNFKEAYSVYTRILEIFPGSYKEEAVRYRMKLIELMYREEEILSLLRWSHEELLLERQAFIKKESQYEKILADFQLKITALEEKLESARLAAARAPDEVAVTETAVVVPEITEEIPEAPEEEKKEDVVVTVADTFAEADVDSDTYYEDLNDTKQKALDLLSRLVSLLDERRSQ